MKYIAFDFYAVKEIISSKKLQSAEFSEAVDLVNFLKGNGDFILKGILKGVTKDNGKFIIAGQRDENKLLVFDIGGFKGFDKTPQEVITIVQKACRLAIKLWNKIGFSPCEKIISGTSYIALLPFSFSTGKSYKVMLDKAPDSKRQGKRGDEHFLVFHDGLDQADVSPSLAALRDAEDEFKAIPSAEGPIIPAVKNGNSYIEIAETKVTGSPQSPFMGMDYWTNNLTKSQKDFVFSRNLGPSMLKGAAGTGKTLCLVLRCINQLIEHKKNSLQLKAVFFTHSIATKNTIEALMVSNGGENFLSVDSLQYVHVTTLQEWCISNLGGRISATEYLDKDAMESKNIQLLYITEAYEEFINEDFKSSKYFISPELADFFDVNDSWSVSVHIQSEISTYIKGRANENFDVYKGLPRSKNSIPLKSDEDFRTIFFIYNSYQKKLTDLNLFDSDDITISALQETSTPIWRRRRINDGYDVLFIDETHLFNMNELSLFHNLLKKNNTNIVFTIDRSQASGDSTLTAVDVKRVINTGDNLEEEYGFKTVFRCSDQIINLASCVLASGATLFSQMENPLSGVTAGFNADEENLSKKPYIIEAMGYSDLINKAFAEVDLLSKRLHVPRSNILMIPCDDFTLEKIKTYSHEKSLSLVNIESRGDYGAVKMASQKSSYLSGTMDFIGGLEFPAVVIIGIDQDKIPKKCSINGEANHFLKYSSFNQLYVAITRAKYTVAFITDKTQGVSEIIQNAIDEDLIEIK